MDCLCHFFTRLTPQQVLAANAEYAYCNAQGCFDAMPLHPPPATADALAVLVIAATVAAAAVAQAVAMQHRPNRCASSPREAR